MCSKDLLLLACLFLWGGLRLTSTTTTTTFVAAMSIANQDLDRYFRTVNATQIMATEDRIMMDVFNYAFLNYSYTLPGEIEPRKITYSEEKARYGEGRIFTVEGQLVHITDASSVEDDTACSPNILGTSGKPTPASDVVWIALVRRGRCTFEEKVKNVHAKGAHGVIIYNDKVVNSLEKMQIKDKNRNITAVITYQDIGLELANIVDRGTEVHVIIAEGRHGSRPINTLNRTSVLFVSISFIVLMVISLVWLLFYYIQRFRYLQTKDQQSRQLCSVTKKAIMKIPTKTGKSSDEKDMDSDCCAICIEAYKPSDCIRVLPCKHEFHKNCIDPWLIEHRTCPMCKLDVLKFYGFVVGDQIHSTPSPQHIPPNMGALDERDVEVIVVALAPPFSAAQQPASQPPPPLVAPAPAVASTHTQTPHETHAHAYQSEQPPSQAQPQPQQQQQHSCSSASCSHNNNNCGSHSSNSNCSNNIGCCSGESHFRTGCQQQPVGGVVATSNGRRNSAPLVLQVSTASRQFLGSEESILEYEPERRAAAAAAAVPAVLAPTAANAGVNRPSALNDLIHSRDFVIDFPRIFVLDAGGATGTRESLFPERLPERSQSSLSLAHAKDWMSNMTNKLEEQHGLRRLRKANARDDMQENLLNVCAEAVKKRRSRSADGRYSSSSQARQQAMQLHGALECGLADEANTSDGAGHALPHATTLYSLTETSYAPSRQRQRQDLQRYSQTRRRSTHRNSVPDIPLRELPLRTSTEHSPPRDISITIQLNGEGVNLEQ